MECFRVYAIAVVFFGCICMGCTIWQVCRECDQLGYGGVTKTGHSADVIVFFSAVICFLLTIVKRREFFSIVTPIFTGLPSALFLIDLFSDRKLGVPE